MNVYDAATNFIFTSTRDSSGSFFFLEAVNYFVVTSAYFHFNLQQIIENLMSLRAEIFETICEIIVSFACICNSLFSLFALLSAIRKLFTKQESMFANQLHVCLLYVACQVSSHYLVNYQTFYRQVYNVPLYHLEILKKYVLCKIVSIRRTGSLIIISICFIVSFVILCNILQFLHTHQLKHKKHYTNKRPNFSIRHDVCLKHDKVFFNTGWCFSVYFRAEMIEHEVVQN